MHVYNALIYVIAVGLYNMDICSFKICVCIICSTHTDTGDRSHSYLNTDTEMCHVVLHITTCTPVYIWASIGLIYAIHEILKAQDSKRQHKTMQFTQDSHFQEK